jgi:glutathione synthase
MRILVLTDHATHGKGESIYPLLRTMAAQRPRAELMVASRVHQAGSTFFDVGGASGLSARQLDEHFCYDEHGRWFEKQTSSVDARDFDLIFLRIDRDKQRDESGVETVVSPEPWLLDIRERLPDVPMLNEPKGILSTGSKRFLEEFRHLCPPLRMCESIQDVQEFLAEHGEIVVKPLHGWGGKGLIRLARDRGMLERTERQYQHLLSMIDAHIARDGSVLAVKFLNRVSEGDKRVIVVNGEVVGATLRLPARGSWLCNLSAGGSSRPSEADALEREIAVEIAEKMNGKGVPLFGFDTLVSSTGKRLLSEINTLNVGGLIQAETGRDGSVVKRAARQIWSYIDGQ